MGKKKNKKFNKVKHRAQINQPMPIGAGISAAMAAETIMTTEPLTPSLVSPSMATAAVDPRYLLIRKEVRTVLVTILILFLVLIGTYVLEQKIGMLDRVGDWIYRVSHIQAQ